MQGIEFTDRQTDNVREIQKNAHGRKWVRTENLIALVHFDKQGRVNVGYRKSSPDCDKGLVYRSTEDVCMHCKRATAVHDMFIMFLNSGDGDQRHWE